MNNTYLTIAIGGAIVISAFIVYVGMQIKRYIERKKWEEDQAHHDHQRKDLQYTISRDPPPLYLRSESFREARREHIENRNRKGD